MYQGTVTGSGGMLAFTGATASMYTVIGAWTLVVAGLALVMTARVLTRRARDRAARDRAAHDAQP